MEFDSVTVFVSSHEPAVWLATPFAAIAYALAVFFGARVIWAGADTRRDALLRLIGTFALFLSLLTVFAGVHNFFLSLAFWLLHGGSFGTRVFTKFVSSSRILVILGGLFGYVAAAAAHSRRAWRPTTPA